jgi:putative ATPase
MLGMLEFKGKHKRSSIPLAERLRPKTFREFIGQKHLVGENGLVTRLIKENNLCSLIFWGPPGTGKTTLTILIRKHFDYPHAAFAAVTTSIKEIKTFMQAAKKTWEIDQHPSIIFIDEIHRFNRAQQDAFLPYLEKNIIFLLATTTENPSFYLTSPLLSRCKVLPFYPLSFKELSLLIKKALNAFAWPIIISDELMNMFSQIGQGDARVILNTLELAVEIAPLKAGKKVISTDILETVLKEVPLRYDRSGEEHYNLISAFIKSMRGSDPDAAIYWLERMVVAGEDPLFILRRMLIFASEDVGNADPKAIQVVVAALEAFKAVGLPEGVLNLIQAASYLASAPKSNAVLKAHQLVQKDIKTYGSLSVPLHLRNAPSSLLKKLGYGAAYKYPHNYPNAYVHQIYLPDELKKACYYYPSSRGFEMIIKLRLRKLWSDRK